MAPIFVSSVPNSLSALKWVGRPAQDIDEGLLGVLPPVERAEQNRALDFGVDGVGPGRLARQQILELPQPRFLRQPGSPAAIGCRQCRARAAAFCFSPVTMSASSTPVAVDRPTYPLIRCRRVSVNFTRLRPRRGYCRIFPAVASKRPEANFRAGTAECGGKTLFTKNLHGSVHLHRNQGAIHDCTRVGHLLSRTPISALRPLHGSCASGWNITPPAGSTTRLPPIKPVSPPPRMNRPAAYPSRPSPTCIHISAMPAWSAAISSWRRQTTRPRCGWRLT